MGALLCAYRFLLCVVGGRGYTDGFSADVETGSLRFNDRPDVKGKEKLAAKCGSWPGRQRGGRTSGIRSHFVSERRQNRRLAFLGGSEATIILQTQ